MTSSTAPAGLPETTYDQLSYTNHAFVQSHPDRQALVAKMFGVSPPSLKSPRVLELGCGRGANLLSMAERFPNGTYLGIDLSARQIDEAQQLTQKRGLENVEFRQADIGSLNSTLGRFDYIACHGVFSWVAATVQERILEISSSLLNENGLAYISYNTLPGWHLKAGIREMMTFQDDKSADPAHRVTKARSLLQFLSEAVPKEQGAYGQLLQDEFRLLSGLPDNYLFHEHLEDENHPMYFHEFVDKAKRFGLQYLGETEVRGMMPIGLPASVAGRLRDFVGNFLQMEQYLDFLRNRMFRQSILCHDSVQVDRNLQASRMIQFAFTSTAKLMNDQELQQTAGPAYFVFRTHQGRSVRTADLILVTLFEVMAENKAKPTELAEFRTQIRAREHEIATQRAAIGLPPLPEANDEAGLDQIIADHLLQAYLGGMVEPVVIPNF